MAESNNSDNGQVSIWPIAWRFSFITAGCLFLYSLFLYATGLVTSSFLGLVSTVIFIVLLVTALKKYRAANNGYMTFGQASLIGLAITVVANVISSALEAVYFAVAGDSMMKVLDEIKAQLESSGIDQQMVDMLMNFYNFVFTPVGIFIMGTCTGVIAGVVISLIVAAIVRNPPPITE